jgi:RimJ/RimL family protein N-acetyltransferase
MDKKSLGLPPGMEIRQMKREEAEEISRIYARSWKTAYRNLVPQEYLDSLSETRWCPILLENPSKSYVLIDGGQLIGTASFSPARDEAMSGWGEIISLYLLPEHFGKGYGRALLRFCVRALDRAGFPNVYLWTLEENRRARAFYEAAGFRPDGQKMAVSIGGELFTEIRYISPVK